MIYTEHTENILRRMNQGENHGSHKADVMDGFIDTSRASKDKKSEKYGYVGTYVLFPTKEGKKTVTVIIRDGCSRFRCRGLGKR